MNTPFLDDVYNKVDFDRELVFKFFTVFSLFEYALKNTKYRQFRNGKVEANWELFVDDIPNFTIAPMSELDNAVNYLINRPPKKQILDANSHLTFEEQVNRPIGLSDLVWLSILIRRVRNNLFHGGKFRYERPRDTELISHSLIILESWSQCNNDVKKNLMSA